MPNEQVNVPLFAASEILTAANMNISAGTGVPVFATTVTRDAAFGGAGEKVLAEGQLCYLSDSNIVQYYDGAAWATVGPATPSALVRVGGGTLSGSSTAFTNVFSATYHAYKIVVSNATNSAGNYIGMILGATTTGYLAGYPGTVIATSAASTDFSTVSTAFNIAYGNITDIACETTLINPQLAKKTHISSMGWATLGTTTVGGMSGHLNNSTQYTGFTLSTATGTFTGTVNIYGYSLS